MRKVPLVSWLRAQAVGEAARPHDNTPPQHASRRAFLKSTARLAALAAAGSALGRWREAQAARRPGGALSVGIVGAGLAGLTAARELSRLGADVSVYEGSSRVGGRVWSLRDRFPGQVAERGGELIDNLHKTMLAYAQEFGLTLEDVNKADGECLYHFGGTNVPEAQVVEEFRAFVDAMQADLRDLSSEVSARAFTEADLRLDRISLDAYLDGQNATGERAGPLLRETLRTAYCIEYGLESWDLSCINFLHFMHADKRSSFKPWGVFSDERWHIVGGNDQVTTRLAEAVAPALQFGMMLVRVARQADGRIELTFSDGRTSTQRTHDRVILALPFSVLRDVDLDATLELPQWKTETIQRFSLGTNTKQMIGFGGRPWAGAGGNGASFADLDSLQCTWETNVSASSPTRAVLTDYAGGERGAFIDPRRPQDEATKFLSALDRILPGASAQALRDRRGYITHIEHWPSNPRTRGSYSAYRPGDFTRLAGLEGLPVGNLHFAGEHTDSFYSWQGFMEGACLSGLRTAAEVLGN